MSEVVSEEFASEEGAVEEIVAFDVSTLELQLHMREEIQLQVAPRQEQGKGPVGRLRREQGMLPGVLYGHKQPPLSFKVEERALERLLSKGSQNAVFLVEVEGEDREPQRAVVRAIQYHKVLGSILHLDLIRIDPEERLRVSIPLIVQGIPAGVRAGGALQQSLSTIELECLASELPSSLELDVSPLNVGDNIHVRDLLDKESRILTDSERTIVTVLAPRLAEEDDVAAVDEEGEIAEGEGAEGEIAEGEGAEGEGEE